MHGVAESIWWSGDIVFAANPLLGAACLAVSLSFQAFDQIFAAVVDLQPVCQQQNIDRINPIFYRWVAGLAFDNEAALLQQ